MNIPRQFPSLPFALVRTSTLTLLLLDLVVTSGRSQSARNPAPAPIKSPASGEAIELSPFEVKADKDTGYAATSTLQGGRGRIELADVSGQVAVFTKDFLEDLGLTNTEQAFLFSANTQTYYDTVNATGANQSGAQQSYDVNSSRGLGAVSKTRNFFATNIEPDVYNTDRFSIVSGANGVQFGLGGPAGTAESTGAVANLRNNSLALSARFDNYGTRRASISYNQVLLKDVLAVRAAVLRDDTEFFLRPGYENTKRAFLATTYRPFRNTLVKLEGEWVKRLDARGSTVMTRDAGYLPYLASVAAGSPISFSNTPASASTAGRPPVPVYVNADGTATNYAFNTNQLLFINPANTSPAFSGLKDVRNTVLPPVPAVATRRSFIHPDYPWDVNPMGPSRYNRRATARLSASVEQRLGRNTVLQLAATTEEYRHVAAQLMGSDRLYDLMVDVNRFLPDGLTPNPMYGRAFAEANVGGSGNWENQSIDQYRGTLVHEHDFTRLAGWRQHLGRHQVAIFGSYDATLLFNLTSQSFMILGTPSFLSAAAQADPLHPDRRFTMRYYLPPLGSSSDPAAYSFPDPSPYGDVLGTLAFSGPNGVPFRVSMHENPIGFVAGAINGFRVQRGSAAASTSSQFFHQRLVVNLGVRRDRVRNSDLRPGLLASQISSATGSTLRAYPDYRRAIPPDTWTPLRYATRANYGLVLRPPLVGHWLSLGFDHSKNASLDDQREIYDIEGQRVESRFGESREYSTRFKLLQGRLNAKFNYFTSTSVNEGFSSLTGALYNFETTLLALDPSYAINPLFAPGRNLAANNFRMLSDRTSHGIEFDLTYNPTPNWRFFANVGRTTTEIDIEKGGVWLDYVARRVPVWTAFKGDWTRALYAGATTVQAQYVNAIQNVIDDMPSNIGNPGGNSQTWRTNLVSAYSFSSGRLKGATLGANFRYRGPSVIGFGTFLDARGRTQINKSVVYESERYLITGLMAGYRFRGFGNTTQRVQLNVNNVFNTARMVVSRASPDGSPRQYGRQPGREFVLSIDVSR
ncbi:MAG: hypothetical protein EXS38_07720 [Opitutus sp.]|nr:hypothetical protein [Opitutus sp.]